MVKGRNAVSIVGCSKIESIESEFGRWTVSQLLASDCVSVCVSVRVVCVCVCFLSHSVYVCVCVCGRVCVFCRQTVHQPVSCRQFSAGSPHFGDHHAMARSQLTSGAAHYVTTQSDDVPCRAAARPTHSYTDVL